MVPNLVTVVQQVRASKIWPFRSKEQLCAYTQAVIKALHATDSNFGNLVKSEGQNHCTDSQGRHHATDVALYKSTGQIVDFISSAGFEPDLSKPEPGNDVTWGVGPEGEYPESSWFAPEPGGTVPIPPVEPPVDPSLAGRVTDLESRAGYHQSLIANLFKLHDEVVSQITAINNQIATQVVLKPLPEYVGSFRIFGFNVTIVSRPR